MARKVIHYVNFDLAAKELEKAKGKAFVKKAYRDIEKVLTSNGFTHDQYSGYKSEPLTRFAFEDVMKTLIRQLPYLKDFCNKAHHSVDNPVYGSSDILNIWEATKEQPDIQEFKEPHHTEKLSLDSKLDEAREKMNRQKETAKSYDRGKEKTR